MIAKAASAADGRGCAPVTTPRSDVSSASRIGCIHSASRNRQRGRGVDADHDTANVPLPGLVEAVRADVPVL
jgi:hypothetical protein